MKTGKHRSSWLLLFAYLFTVAIGAIAVIKVKAYSAGFSGADEPSHFLNGYFISSYLKSHLGGNPMAFATDFYIHYPKISIGHWPPAYYGLLSSIFLIAPPTYTCAFIWNVLVASLPAIGVAAALGRLCGRPAALAGVVLYAFTPLVLEGQVMFMVDQPLVAAVVAATAIWIAYAEQPSWARALAFAAMAALAVLIKGNGWLVVFIPLYQVALSGTWRKLVSVKLLSAAALGALLVVPWYLVTSKIAADGFNYQAGPEYAMKALGANLIFLVDNISWIGVALALYAVIAEFRARAGSGLRWTIVSALAGLVLATITLQSLVPVDIVDRYMAPALPAIVVLAIVGAVRLLELVPAQKSGAWRILGWAVLTVAMAWTGISHLLERQPKADVSALQVARKLAPTVNPGITIVDGSSAYEGAFIAAMAVNDPALQSYVVRASKLLADSNFMGSVYTLKFHDSQQVLSELQRLGVQHVVIIRAGDQAAFPHSEQLRLAVASAGSGYRLSEQLPHQNRSGVTEVYEALTPARPNIAAVRRMGLPAKVSALREL